MGALKIAQLWMLIRPIRLIRNRRRAGRGLPPLTDEDVMPDQSTVTMADGRTITKTEPLLPGRSSTKAATLGLVSLPVLQLLQEIAPLTPFTWDDKLVTSAAFAQVVTLVMMYLTARYTKSPSDAGAI